MYLDWLKSFIVLIPIWMAGIAITKKIISEKRAEVVIPLGIIAGTTIYIFLLNVFAYIFKGLPGIIISLIALLILGLASVSKTIKLDLPKGKTLFLWILSIAVWGLFLAIPVSHIIFWAEDNIYFSIGKTFAKGNFPILSPWQPDLYVAYHYGGSVFLGALNALTGVHLDLLRRLIPIFLILSIVQLLIWGLKRHSDYFSFLIHQIIPLIGMVSFGSLMIVWPIFPLQLPDLSSFPTIPTWVRQLPTLAQTPLDTYGMDSRLEMVFYHLHSSFGLASVFLTVFLCLYQKPSSKLFWLVLGINLVSLAIINESLLPSAIIASFLILFTRVNHDLHFFNIKSAKLIAFYLITSLAILFQGGVITDGFIRSNNQESAISITPLSQLPLAIQHFSQLTIHQLPINKDWLPFQWYHLEFVWLYIIAFACIPSLIFSKNQTKSLTFFALVVSAIVCNLLYYFVIPTYLPSDANRFRGSAFLFLGLAIAIGITSVFEILISKKKIIPLVLLGFVSFWVLAPSVIPNAFQFIHFRYQQNFFLTPEYDNLPPVMNWIDRNINGTERVLDLAGYINYLTEDFYRIDYDGTAKPLAAYTGVLTPFWDSKYRAYFFAPGPDFLDILYSMNPSTLKKLKISYLMLDKQYFDTLPLFRQQQIQEGKYFTQVFMDQRPKTNNYWIAVYKIHDKYFQEAENIPQTSEYLNQIIPAKANILIEKEAKPFSWLQLRNAIILTLKDRTLWLTPGEGGYGYLNTSIPFKVANNDQQYDYLILKTATDPKSVCSCAVESVWTGFNKKVTVWKVLYYI